MRDPFVILMLEQDFGHLHERYINLPSKIIFTIVERQVHMGFVFFLIVEKMG